MNNQVLLLRNYYENPQITQRQLAASMEVSLGTVNNLITAAEDSGMIEKKDPAGKGGYNITKKGMDYLEDYRVDKAVIFAAGFGSRLVPLTWDTPKGLLKVFGERMIERQIRQLHAVGVTDIVVMVGYMKERFEYLKEKYGVELIFNPEYDCKNTISTLHCAKDHFLGHNTYLLYCDNWLRNNMFHTYEPNAWYSSVYKEGKTSEWPFIFNKKNLITDILEGGADAWVMFGPVYFSKEFSEKFIPVNEQYYNAPATENDYLEQIYLDWLHSSHRIIPLDAKNIPELYINKQPANQIHEFDSFEEMREFDEYYKRSSVNRALEIISETFNVPAIEIKNIADMKIGITNHSFLFTVHEKPYICRVPWDVNGKFVDRHKEYETIQAIRNLGISENVIYYDPETGYKISEYYSNTRYPDINSDTDIRKCMKVLHRLHDSGVKVNHDYDFRLQLKTLEDECLECCSIDLPDYEEIKKNFYKLIDKVDSLNRKKTIVHADPNVCNWLFIKDTEEVKLIDWEYAGMADPLLEVAGMANYSFLDKEGIDRITDLFIEGRRPTEQERGIVYAFIALIGFCWAVWSVRAIYLGGNYEEYKNIHYTYMQTLYKEAMDRL